MDKAPLAAQAPAVMAPMPKLRLPLAAVLAPAAAAFAALAILAVLVAAFLNVYRNTVPLLADQAEVLLAALDVLADPALAPEALSRRIDRLAVKAGGVGFVLDAEDRLVAHPAIATGLLRPGVEARANDAILAAIHDPKLVADTFDRGGMKGWLVAVRGDHYGVALKAHSRRPEWRLGVYLLRPSGLDLFRPADRLLPTLGVALLMLMLATGLLAHRLVGPLKGIAAAAEGLAGDEPTRVPPLSPRGTPDLRRVAAAINRLREVARIYDGLLPRALARRFSATPLALRPRRREVTVLATGLAGLNSLTRGLDDDATVELVRRHLTLVAGRIAARGGHVFQVRGDGLLALWNGLDEQPDHAARAFACVRDIARLVSEENAGRRAPFRLCLGLASGGAMVGDIGPAGRVSFTALGAPVALARRLERACRTAPLEGDVRCLAAASGIEGEPVAGIAKADVRAPQLYEARGGAAEMS
jgi:class 3 adenylate cyclase